MKNKGGNIWLKKTVLDPELDRIDAPTGRTPRVVPSLIEPYRPENVWLLGEGWFVGEADHCWMEQSASVQIAGPAAPDQRLRIRGLSPHTGGARLSASVDDIQLGSMQFESAGPVDAEFALPAAFVGRPAITVQLEIDQKYKAPEDLRDLGLSVMRIEVS
jgi:hypothetical protein